MTFDLYHCKLEHSNQSYMKKQSLLFLSFFLVSGVFAQYPVTGLKAYWNFENNTTDSLPDHITLQSQGGVSYVQAKRGMGVKFAIGSLFRNQDSVSTMLYPSSDFTYAFWAKMDTANSSYRCFFIVGQSIFLRTLGANFEYGYHYGAGAGGGNYYTLTAPSKDSTWMHLALVYNSNSDSLLVYKNGNMIHKTKVAQPHTMNYNSFYMGTQVDQGVPLYSLTKFNGIMDEFFYYDRALTTPEINLVMNDAVPDTTPHTAIKENTFDATLLYPNPAKDQLTLDIAPSAALDGLCFELINAAGQQVQKGYVTERSMSLALGNQLASGLYHLRLVNQDAVTVWQSKVVLNKE